MSNALVFDFDGEPVRWDYEGGEVLGRARDLCRCLGIVAAERAYDRIPTGEKVLRTAKTAGGDQTMLWLREAGIYRLIFESRKPGAERFKAWVFSEVLPTIRRTGSYGRSGLAPKEAASAMAQVKLCKSVFGPAHARALWREIGLPYAEPSAEDIAATKPPERPVRETVPAVDVAPVAQNIAEGVRLLLDRDGVDGAWSGTATQLLRALKSFRVKNLPETAQKLGNALASVRNVLKTHGIEVSRHHSGIRRVIIRRIAPEAGIA